MLPAICKLPAVGGTRVVNVAEPVENTVLFDADLASGTLDAYAATIHPEHAYIEDDPILGPARKVVRMTVPDTDTGPTENPRVQLQSPSILAEGDDAWIGWSTLFPADWPDLPAGGWAVFASVYGPPYTTNGPNALSVGGSGTTSPNFRYGTNYDMPFPLIRGAWMDFCLHLVMSSLPGGGLAELYTCISEAEGWQLRHSWSLATLAAGANDGGPNEAHINLYRLAGMFDSMTLYHADHRIGTTFSAAAPGSYPAAALPSFA
jgi:hypothetical protein